MNIRPEVIGGEGLLSPFLQFVSSQRNAMSASAVCQALQITNPEQALISSGFESIFGEYEFDNSTRDEDCRIIGIIPKFAFINLQGNTPKYTVLYEGLDSGQLSYFDIEQYHVGSNQFGFKRDLMNFHELRPDNFVSKDTVFQRSPIKKDGRYMLGRNVNVAFMSHPTVTEDAFGVSDKLLEDMGTLGIKRIKLTLNETDIPLDLYGNEDGTAKIMPDIGESVNPDGIICGFRKFTKDGFNISDFTEKSLRNPQRFHDKLYYVEDPADATIVDIDVWIRPSALRKSTAPTKRYEQLLKYHQEISAYYRRIIEVYKTSLNTNLSDKLNNLIVKAYSFLAASGDPVVKAYRSLKFQDNKVPVNFITVEFVVAYQRKFNHGFKLTGRDGSKGVVCQIIDRKHMPVDDYGIVADMLINPMGMYNRMNPGQQVECAINRMSIFINRKAKEMDTHSAYVYILEYLRRLHPAYAERVEDTVANHPVDGEHKFVQECREHGILIVIPPTLRTISAKHVADLYQEYDIPITPVEFDVLDVNGDVIRRVRSKKPILIGPKYIFLLGKIPKCRSSGVGQVDQFGCPYKSKSSDAHKSPVSKSPIRIFGEDETRNLDATIGSELIARNAGLYGNSPVALEALQIDLLTHPHPSAYRKLDMSTKTITDTNVRISTMKHMFRAIGLDITREGIRKGVTSDLLERLGIDG
jgi:hypothetical protein